MDDTGSRTQSSRDPPPDDPYLGDSSVGLSTGRCGASRGNDVDESVSWSL